MDKGKTRLVSVIAVAGALMACGSASSPSSSDGSLSLLDGTWACSVNGQGPLVTLETHSHCSWLATNGGDGTQAADWLICDDDISGNVGTVTRCFAAVTTGTISVSADGDTLTISETGSDPPDAGTVESFNAACMRTAPSQVRCSSDGGVIQETDDASVGNDASKDANARSTQPTPECTQAPDCGGCSRCQSGMCIYCPIGSLGICTC